MLWGHPLTGPLAAPNRVNTRLIGSRIPGTLPDQQPLLIQHSLAGQRGPLTIISNDSQHHHPARGRLELERGQG